MLRRAFLIFGAALGLANGACVEKLAALVISVPALSDSEAESSDGGWLPSDQLSLTAVEPAHGPFTGATAVRLTGSGFNQETRIYVGGQELEGDAKKLLSPLAMRIQTPPHAPGAVSILARRGDEEAVLEGAFVYDPIHLDPASGPTSGGTRVIVQGAGTNFQAGLKLQLGGAEMSEVEVVSATQAKAVTPPGGEGGAALSWTESGGQKIVDDAFRYYRGVNQKSGGFGGGKISGTLTVNVLDWMSRKPIAATKIIVLDSAGRQFAALTDLQGAAVFSEEGLYGPLTLTAAKPGYEVTTMIRFDARDVTVFLMPQPPPDPEPGPMPPGTTPALIKGFVLFGGSTGVGSSVWGSVPEPAAGERKRAYVFVTYPSIFWGSQYPSANATIDYQPTGATAWPYQLDARTGSLAVYAFAGLWTEATQQFTPYVMGLQRGILASPGKTVEVNVTMNIPLDRQVTVECRDLPGPISRHRFLLGVDLGADGLILPMWQDVQGDGLARHKTFAHLPRFAHQGLLDASFSSQVIFYGESAPGLPNSQAIVRQVQPDAEAKIVADQFLGFPSAVDPLAGGSFNGQTLSWSFIEGAPSLAYTVLRTADNVPLWRIISHGAVTAASLPDPSFLGIGVWPAGKIVWQQYLARIPQYSFDQFNYSYLNSTYWDRWSYEEIPLVVP